MVGVDVGLEEPFDLEPVSRTKAMILSALSTLVRPESGSKRRTELMMAQAALAGS